MKAGIEKARAALESGAARARLDDLVRVTTQNGKA